MMILPVVFCAALLHLSAALNGGKEVGCFKDTGSRDLVGEWTNGGHVTNQQCADRCAAQGFDYSATQYSSHCFCDNSYGKYGAASNCNMRCAGDNSQTCGGAWANQVVDIKNHPARPEPLEPLDYIGCYKDKSNRDITGLWSVSKDLTNQKCVAICKEMGFKFAATQYASHCFCGNDYGKYGEYAGACTMNCIADSTQKCGGPWANAVHRTGASGELTPAPTAKPLGCFKDSSNRVMKTLWTQAALMTNEICHKTCLAVGAKYSATQYSNHCFCADVYNSQGGASNCNMKCGGDASDTCGGGWANEVFEIGKAATPAPTEAPTPAPTEAPTPAPTEAPETCLKEKAKFKENGIPVEPSLNADCEFDLKQCNAEKCWCVKAKSGALNYGGVIVPAGEAFDCSRKARKCEKKRFSLLLKGKSGWIPECNKSGKYELKQCHGGECWCVKPKGGKERKNTRTTGDLTC